MTSNRRWSVSADSQRALPKTLMVRGLTGGGGFKDVVFKYVVRCPCGKGGFKYGLGVRVVRGFKYEVRCPCGEGV